MALLCQVGPSHTLGLQARFGEFYVVIVRAIPDVIAMLLMTVPSIPLHQIYAVRFVVGFFEAPFLPYLQVATLPCGGAWCRQVESTQEDPRPCIRLKHGRHPCGGRRCS